MDNSSLLYLFSKSNDKTCSHDAKTSIQEANAAFDQGGVRGYEEFLDGLDVVRLAQVLQTKGALTHLCPGAWVHYLSKFNNHNSYLLSGTLIAPGVLEKLESAGAAFDELVSKLTGYALALVLRSQAALGHFSPGEYAEYVSKLEKGDLSCALIAPGVREKLEGFKIGTFNEFVDKLAVAALARVLTSQVALEHFSPGEYVEYVAKLDGDDLSRVLRAPGVVEKLESFGAFGEFVDKLAGQSLALMLKSQVVLEHLPPGEYIRCVAKLEVGYLSGLLTVPGVGDKLESFEAGAFGKFVGKFTGRDLVGVLESKGVLGHLSPEEYAGYVANIEGGVSLSRVLITPGVYEKLESFEVGTFSKFIGTLTGHALVMVLESKWVVEHLPTSIYVQCLAKFDSSIASLNLSEVLRASGVLEKLESFEAGTFGKFVGKLDGWNLMWMLKSPVGLKHFPPGEYVEYVAKLDSNNLSRALIAPEVLDKLEDFEAGTFNRFVDKLAGQSLALILENQVALEHFSPSVYVRYVAKLKDDNLSRVLTAPGVCDKLESFEAGIFNKFVGKFTGRDLVGVLESQVVLGHLSPEEYAGYVANIEGGVSLSRVLITPGVYEKLESFEVGTFSKFIGTLTGHALVMVLESKWVVEHLPTSIYVQCLAKFDSSIASLHLSEVLRASGVLEKLESFEIGTFDKFVGKLTGVYLMWMLKSPVALEHLPTSIYIQCLAKLKDGNLSGVLKTPGVLEKLGSLELGTFGKFIGKLSGWDLMWMLKSKEELEYFSHGEYVQCVAKLESAKHSEHSQNAIEVVVVEEVAALGGDDYDIIDADEVVAASGLDDGAGCVVV